MPSRWKSWAKALKREAYTLYFACRDRRTPWYARALAGLVAAYAFSPLDLIPDTIPVLGYLDDLILVPLGVALVRWMIPAEVLADARAKAEAMASGERPRSYTAAAVIIAIWLVLAAVAVLATLRFLR